MCVSCLDKQDGHTKPPAVSDGLISPPLEIPFVVSDCRNLVETMVYLRKSSG